MLTVVFYSFLWLVTNIPVETPGQDEPARASRPPWIRPVRKKAPSLARSTHSGGGGDSPPPHSSPEAFSPSDFFVEPPNSVFPSTPSSASGCSQPSNNNNTVPSPPQYVNNGTNTNGGALPPHSQTQTNNTTYMDTSGDMGMDPQMYSMFPGEMMALFNDGAVVDVCQLFPSVEFLQQQQQSSMSHQMQSDRQSIGEGGPGGGGGSVTGFTSPTFLNKRDGIVNS